MDAMHGITFLQDLAVVMILAGLVTVVFHRFKQPVVLGYILAGVIIGPHTPPFPPMRPAPAPNTLRMGPKEPIHHAEGHDPLRIYVTERARNAKH